MDLYSANKQDDDIEVYFVEEHTGWRTKAKIEKDGVLSNNIIFYTPSYVNANITSKVKVAVQLRRPSDGVWSNTLPFTFVPSLTNKDIPLQKQMDMHSNLKATHFIESGAVGQPTSEAVLGESSKLAIQDVSQKCHRLHKVKEHQETIDDETSISDEFHQQLKPSKDNCKHISRLQHKMFSVSEDSGFGSYVSPSNEEQPIEDVYKVSKTQEVVPKLDSQQSNKRSLDDASENLSDVEVDCIAFRGEVQETISSIPNPNCISVLKRQHNLIENSPFESTSSCYHSATSTLTSPEDIGSGGIIDCKIHFPPLGTKTEIIPRIKVDCSGACLKLPDTGVQLIIPPYAIPEGSIAEIGLALDWNYLNVPGEEKDEGCIAPIITCLPNHYAFQKPVLIVFPHSVKEVIEEECINLYTNEKDADEKKDWKQVKYNQKDDTSSPVLFLKNQYAYLFVQHFTDHNITLPSGETCIVRYLRIVVYANELSDCETNQEVRIYCHGERDDLKKMVEEEENALGGIRKAFLAKFELFKKSNVVLKVSVEFERGWHIKSHKIEQFLKSIWRKDYGSCKYTFKNVGQMSSFYCNITIQQIDCEEVSLDISNRVKHPIDTSTQNAPAEPLRGPPPVYMVENGGNQPLSTNSGYTSVSRLSGSYSHVIERYHGGLSSYSSDSHSHSCNLPPNPLNSQYVMPRQNSCPHDSQGNLLQNANSLETSPPNLRHQLRMELGFKLDPNHPLGKDWRMLACNLNADNLIGRLDARSSYPTSQLLTLWDSQNETLEMLVKRLNDIERPDAAKLVKDYIDKTNQTSSQQSVTIGALDAHPSVPKCLPNQSSTITPERPVGTFVSPSSPEETSDISKMSTSSSTSSFAVTPDRESDPPAFQRRSSDVFYDTNFNQNMSALTRNTEDLRVNDVTNANIPSNKPS